MIKLTKGKKLEKISPLLPFSSERKKKIIEKIRVFFKEKNQKFLSRMWED
ncbi:MAG: hypothetical protein ACK4FL_02500 [Microgenomates group bacterium]